MSRQKPEVQTIWVIQGSRDQTEGRTGYVDRESFWDFDKAVEVLLSGRWGVQGMSEHTDLVERVTTANEDGTLVHEDIKLWGYHKSIDDTWRHGWVDDRDVAKFADPEFVKYLELKRRFEGNDNG